MVHLKKVFVVAGPTAGGKSSFALSLASQINGDIINADSLQVYKDLKILSARPDEASEIPHHLYGYLDAFQTINVTQWLNNAVEKILSCEKPIVVGGTGFYLNALLEGIHQIPDVDPYIREKVRAMPLEEVKSLVKECVATDNQRLRRALEVQLTTGKPLSYFYTLPKICPIKADFQKILILPDRQKLYRKSDQRFYDMIQEGAIEEVKYLKEIQATGGVLKAIGVKEISLFLDHRLSKEEMILLAQTATRHYAKRQITWFKHQFCQDVLLTNTSETSLFLKNM